MVVFGRRFMKNISWLSFGKLRGSYGSSGSDNIGDYQPLIPLLRLISSIMAVPDWLQQNSTILISAGKNHQNRSCS
jgi:hypothetical protein